jgi:hypothetical protein
MLKIVGERSGNSKIKRQHWIVRYALQSRQYTDNNRCQNRQDETAHHGMWNKVIPTGLFDHG